ncbi:MAG: alpha/beta hydrolase [Alphaproteobacteria bacterium]|nr:alpha/beta hydrolase [Alphaproteobacteria bacterium]MBV9372007.1 alpha/beta hydrolase [Alphaproteobacteria bacterium]MBV9901719.1 alpha/beta hydrolase [Alphaproteobacteria bacterium]
MAQFRTADGTRIAFEDEGEGRPLVLLHGLMAHAGFFEAQRALADRFRIVRIDLRGHGRPPRGGDGPSIETAAQDVAGLCRALGLEGAIGIGWSLGAAVLWHVLTGPEAARFAGAVVVDMTPRVMNDGDWALGLSPDLCEARAEAIRADFEGFATAAGAAIFAQAEGEARHPLAAWAGAEFARNDAGAIGALWASLVAQDFRPRLAAIRQPTLVVHGARSHLYGPDTADHLVAALPDATLVRFERSGHAPHIEQPDLFNATLLQFAAKLPPVRQTQTA